MCRPAFLIFLFLFFKISEAAQIIEIEAVIVNNEINEIEDNNSAPPPDLSRGSNTKGGYFPKDGQIG